MLGSDYFLNTGFCFGGLALLTNRPRFLVPLRLHFMRFLLVHILYTSYSLPYKVGQDGPIDQGHNRIFPDGLHDNANHALTTSTLALGLS